MFLHISLFVYHVFFFFIVFQFVHPQLNLKCDYSVHLEYLKIKKNKLFFVLNIRLVKYLISL